MTGKNLYIKDLTLKEIESIKLKNSNFNIPTLEKVLNLISGKVPLLIEIKNEGEVGNLEQILKDTLTNYKGLFILESFNPFVVKYFKKYTNYFCGLLACKCYTHSFKNKIVGLFINLSLSLNIFNVDFIAYKFREMDSKVYRKIKKSKLPLIFWTIKDQKEAKEALKIGDCIIVENIRP